MTCARGWKTWPRGFHPPRFAASTLLGMTKKLTQLTLPKSKIHRAVVTGASLDYEGSLTISADLAELVRLIPTKKFS
jgi:hypothetical protein